MRYVIIGCGTVGMELARRWAAAGHEVVGTTTTPDRVPLLKEVCAEVAVLRGNEAAKVKDVLAEADAVVIAVSPKLDRVTSRRERAAEFRDTLVGTARTVVGAHRRVVLLSSTVVYGVGDGDDPGDTDPGGAASAPGAMPSQAGATPNQASATPSQASAMLGQAGAMLGQAGAGATEAAGTAGESGGGSGERGVDEQTRRTFDLEPSAQGYATAERVVLELITGTVLRLPFLYYQGSPTEADPAGLARYTHEPMSGSVPVCADALAYRVDFRDAAAAAEFAVARGLTGVYNVVPDEIVPPTYESLHEQLTRELGLPQVSFRNELKTPTRPISSAKLREAGFSFTYGNPPYRTGDDEQAP